MQAAVSPKTLVETLTWRYATKRFDSQKKIPADVWTALEESLVLTPSSYGLQPWKFLIVQTPELRKKLREKSWGQSQVEDASHLVVFTVLRGMSDAYLDAYMKRTAEVRGVPVESLAGFKKALVAGSLTGPKAELVAEWNARQSYIALGNFMTSAALVGVDTCPLEGLDPLAYDKILDLEFGPYQTVVACAAGYRHKEDKYSQTPKVRFEKSAVVAYL